MGAVEHRGARRPPRLSKEVTRADDVAAREPSGGDPCRGLSRVATTSASLSPPPRREPAQRRRERLRLVRRDGAACRALARLCGRRDAEAEALALLRRTPQLDPSDGAEATMSASGASSRASATYSVSIPKPGAESTWSRRKRDVSVNSTSTVALDASRLREVCDRLQQRRNELVVRELRRDPELGHDVSLTRDLRHALDGVRTAVSRARERNRDARGRAL